MKGLSQLCLLSIEEHNWLLDNELGMQLKMARNTNIVDSNRQHFGLGVYCFGSSLYRFKQCETAFQTV